MTILLIVLCLFINVNFAFAQEKSEVNPLYQLPQTSVITEDETTLSSVFLVGSDNGLYKITSNNNVFPLWEEGRVDQLIQLENSAWLMRTSKGIFYTEDLVNFEERTNGLPFLTIKKYIEKERNSNNILTYKVLIFLAIYTISYINGGHINLVNNELGSSFIIFLLYTTSGIFLLVTIFKYISQKDNVIFGIFRNISRNALIILCVHFFYAFWFDELFHANFYYKLLFVIICTIISIPIFRCYLYKLIGKEKISIKESLSIK